MFKNLNNSTNLGKLVTMVLQHSVIPITFNGWGEATLCGSLSVPTSALTYKLTKVTADQMDPNSDDLIKWSIIRPPTLADIGCEG